jgi:DNA-binding protein HU-beta
LWKKSKSAESLIGKAGESSLLTFGHSFQHLHPKSPTSLVCSKFSNTFGIEIQFLTKKRIIMNKAELIEAMASDAGISKADAKRALDAFISTTSGALKKGDRVALVGFGSFSISNRSARTGRNPQTGKEIQIAAKNVVKFKAGAELSGSVN